MPGGKQSSAVRWRTVARILCLIALLLTASILAREYIDTQQFTIRPGNEDAVHRSIMISAALYAVLLAIPFVPGAEIGLGLIAALGPPIAILVYLCTVFGLTLSFIIGRLIPLLILIRVARDIGFERTGRLLETIEPLDRKQRLEYLLDRSPRRLLPVLLRYRYLALAVALNIPGNYLIGGGGGIALFAGVSRIFSVTGFLLTIALAVAPVPVAVLVFGIRVTGQ